MPLPDVDKDRVKADYLEWSGGYGPDLSEDGMDVYLEDHVFEDMDHDDVEVFLEEWEAELEAVSDKAFEERETDPVVWQGTLSGDDKVRIRRLGEDDLLAERRAPDGDWEATDDRDAMRAYHKALLESLGGRGLPKGAPGSTLR